MASCWGLETPETLDVCTSKITFAEKSLKDAKSIKTVTNGSRTWLLCRMPCLSEFNLSFQITSCPWWPLNCRPGAVVRSLRLPVLQPFAAGLKQSLRWPCNSPILLHIANFPHAMFSLPHLRFIHETLSLNVSTCLNKKRLVAFCSMISMTCLSNSSNSKKHKDN